MKTVNCNECNSEVGVHADACPSCGSPIDTIKAYNEYQAKYSKKIKSYWISNYASPSLKAGVVTVS